ncbi:hypothetical protein H2204_004077 [Knufia peltigerae]|uniref:Uncharacterized protein n=1 Tax=Knufia peltigerae TaxID=1002370 RepID=A0AA38Y7S0_9EURO|nr:hypothetical protein H2204_004077 [Knufia peltigerae]
MSIWERLGLNQREMKKARQEAGKFLGPEPSKWEDLGADKQKRNVEEYLQYLRQNENNTIADKLQGDEEAIYELLRLRTKTIRSKTTAV